MLLTNGWLASASVSFYPDTARLALDGQADTRWTTGASQTPDVWYEIDMLQPQIFFALTLDTQSAPADSPALLDVYLSMDGTFSTPTLKSISGSGLTTISFPNAQVARYIKLALSTNKSEWWSVYELTVKD